MLDDLVRAERERILRELDGLVDLSPGGIVTVGHGGTLAREQYDRDLFDAFRRIVNG